MTVELVVIALAIAFLFTGSLYHMLLIIEFVRVEWRAWTASHEVDHG